MKSKIKKALIFTGIIMLLAAAALCVFNIIQDKQAYEKSQDILNELKLQIPEPTEESSGDMPENPADDLFLPYEDSAKEIPAPISVDGNDYSGYLSLPSLGLELPVADICSYDALNESPCRYSGNAETSDLIIAAHNFSSHFGRIADQNIDDEILYINSSGNTFRYRVNDITVLGGNDTEGIFFGKSSEWDITLFTCTLSGQKRVAVRGCLTDEK